MSAAFTKPILDLMHKVERTQRVMLFMVPARIIRIITIDDSFKTFRVEQLVLTSKDAQNPRGSWNTLSTHSGPQPGAAWGLACEAATEAQTKLLRKYQQARKQLSVPA